MWASDCLTEKYNRKKKHVVLIMDIDDNQHDETAFCKSTERQMAEWYIDIVLCICYH